MSLQRAGVRGVALFRRQRRFGKGITRAKDVDDLLLAGGIDAVDIDGTALHNIKANGGGTFVKEVFALGQGFVTVTSAMFSRSRAGSPVKS